MASEASVPTRAVDHVARHQSELQIPSLGARTAPVAGVDGVPHGEFIYSPRPVL